MDIEAAYNRACVAYRQGINDSDFILVKYDDPPNLAITFSLQIEGGMWAPVGGRFWERGDKAGYQD
jgi:hypothetical protein